MKEIYTLNMTMWSHGKYVGSVKDRGTRYEVSFHVGEEIFCEAFSVEYHSDKETAKEKAETYQRLINEKKKWTKNQWRVSIDDENVIEMELDKNKRTFFPREFLSLLEPIIWYAHRQGDRYCVCGEDPDTKRSIKMHRLICPQWSVIDHIGSLIHYFVF